MTEPNAESPAPVLDPTWDEAVRDIPDRGLDREREATTEQRAALAAALDLVAMPSFRASYRVKPASGGRYTLAGTIEATVEQTCVVTLKPLTNKLRVDLAASFWPEEDVPPEPGGAIDIEDEPDPEPIVDGRLPIGRVVFETLATAIDPFPRAADAALDWQPSGEGSGNVSPFAALARLKK